MGICKGVNWEVAERLARGVSWGVEHGCRGVDWGDAVRCGVYIGVEMFRGVKGSNLLKPSG